MLLQMAGVLDAFDRVFTNIGDKEKDSSKLTKIWVGNFRSVRRLLESSGGSGSYEESKLQLLIH